MHKENKLRRDVGRTREGRCDKIFVGRHICIPPHFRLLGPGSKEHERKTMHSLSSPFQPLSHSRAQNTARAGLFRSHQ
ncbi:hypothetical protein CY34DRAFT_798152 [Suillus luteus UH-Slu-Lm8-n1]|uniref:Uncharacterized protein n=1 Tax=Suillus luteus UH-Slu-Lm8-n1 TaxID=930992 RepID=A0A0D0BG20_9AGAM|nr:hypothetical protein CY34DRAFT_798152 [Suillus luteus UH-Slu-Lm8-n1]